RRWTTSLSTTAVPSSLSYHAYRPRHHLHSFPTRRSSDLPAEQVATVLGGPDVGAAFAGLPFDHLFYTGSTAVGRQVMRAAAENLDRKSTRLNSSHGSISYAVFCLKKKSTTKYMSTGTTPE